MDLLIQYLRQYVRLSIDVENKFVNSFVIKEYQKDDVLVHEGSVCRYLFFLIDGTVRSYFYDDGKEYTTWVYPEGYFVTSWMSFLQELPSHESIQAVQDCKIGAIAKSTLYKLYDDHHGIERFGRLLAEEQISYIHEYSRGHSTLSAKEKYEQLISFFPDITQRINLGHIASLLGISQETLSRIRKN